jgi:hypothetical protein
MIECRGCHRHVRPDELTCPFCDNLVGIPRPRRRFWSVLMLLATPAVLSACYGSPSKDDWGDTGPQDLDNDGFFGDLDDCNDDDPAINPDAEEVCDDGVDNDCDEQIDGDDEDCQGVPGGDTGDTGGGQFEG